MTMENNINLEQYEEALKYLEVHNQMAYDIWMSKLSDADGDLDISKLTPEVLTTLEREIALDYTELHPLK